MGNFYNLVESAKADFDNLDSASRQLYSAWTQAKLAPIDFVDSFYNTGEYVDNEFYKCQGDEIRRVGRAEGTLLFGGMRSVLHLRGYQDDLPQRFESMWQNIGRMLSFNYQEHPVYRTAKTIVGEVMPEFGVAFQENPDRAYKTLYDLVDHFVGKLQESRLLLKTG